MSATVNRVVGGGDRLVRRRHLSQRRQDDTPGQWVFDQPSFILPNVAVGGHFVGSPDASTTFPQSMPVDWVRVHQQE
ncbi:MAG: hypothetical protein OXG58_05105 [Gemmatimonadetes bacterium]|nr:hypothetical protein [Gemmatimonadota bacterium]MCY3942679.1 hypothetical protein [Gemmatimonadota bacterium]